MGFDETTIIINITMGGFCRNRELTLEKDNAGFYALALEQDNIKQCLQNILHIGYMVSFLFFIHLISWRHVIKRRCLFIKYKQYNNSLYINSDCLLVMQKMINKNKKVDCIIVDPPYGINHKSNRRKDKSDMTTRKCILNDKDNETMLKKSIELSYKLLKDKSHIYWFTRWDMLDIHLPMLKKYYNIKNTLIWDKGNRGSGDLLGAYGGRYECIIYGMKGRRVLNKINGIQRHDDILYYFKVPHQKLIHPHQKPIDLLEFLIEKSTNKNETILDMFAGVGSTLVASLNKNRNCIAIELDNDTYNKGIDYVNESIENVFAYTDTKINCS